MPFEIKLESFEGPLELLLDLVEKEKLSINDVSLARVAEEYVARVRSLERFPTADAAGFLVVAATLMLVKSRTLLPSLELTAEEESDIAELEERLALYGEIRAAAQILGRLFGKKMMYPKDPFRGYTASFLTPLYRRQAVTLDQIREAAEDLIEASPQEKPLPETALSAILSLEEKILEVTERVVRALEIKFSEISGHGHGVATDEERVHVIVSFLAVLELVKQGIIMVTQERPFADFDLKANRPAALSSST